MKSQHGNRRSSRHRGKGWVLLLLLGTTGLTSCYASNVVALEDRDVKTREEQAQWKPAEATSIPGLYRSGTIEGESAASLLKLFYYFDEDGSYTAAALVGSSPPSFQVLSGQWKFEDGKLLLGEDASPAVLEESEDMLRLSTEDGMVVLYRDEIR